MSSMVQDLMREIGGGPALSRLSSALDADSAATEKGVMAALPLLVGSLSANSRQPDGAQSLAGALDRDHDGSVLDDLAGFLDGGSTGAGAGILGHVLGERQTTAAAQVGRASGLDTGSAMKLLAMLAPLVMGYLGRTKKREGLGARDLTDLLGRERRQAEQNLPGGFGGLAGFLDADGDGQILDDVAKLGGGLLGSFFDKR